MHPKIQILRELVLHKAWSTLKQYEISYTRRDGQKETQIREIYNSGDGAAILLVNSDAQKILLVRQFRLPVLLNGHHDGFIIESCAGMLDDLNPEAAIIKEVEEETGYKISKIRKIYEAFATPGAHMEKIYFYIGEYNDSMKIDNGGGLLAEQEEIEILEYAFDEIPGLLKGGKIIDAKTIVLLQWAMMEYGLR